MGIIIIYKNFKFQALVTVIKKKSVRFFLIFRPVKQKKSFCTVQACIVQYHYYLYKYWYCSLLFYCRALRGPLVLVPGTSHVVLVHHPRVPNSCTHQNKYWYKYQPVFSVKNKKTNHITSRVCEYTHSKISLSPPKIKF